LRDKTNLTLDRDLWNKLARFAHKQSLIQGKQFSAAKALRMAIRVFLRLRPDEVNEALARPETKYRP
jgi:hypothetical protein